MNKQERQTPNTGQSSINHNFHLFPHLISIAQPANKKNMASELTEEETQEFYAQFSVFDIDGNGSIDVNELGTIMKVFPPRNYNF